MLKKYSKFKMYKMKLMTCLLLIVMVINLSGCAAILKGTHSNVKFYSDPEGATVYIDGYPIGKTPFQAKVLSKEMHNISFKKEGYLNCNTRITNEIGAGWIIADVLLTGLIGIFVDAATGAWFEFNPEHIGCVLETEKQDRQ